MKSKMKKITAGKIYFLLLCMVFIVGAGCKKEDRLDHVDPNSPAPALVSNIKITATPGGALINYTIPKDPNFFYAKAVYEIQPGIFREAKCSYYDDTLALVGYGDTLSHPVSIYSVGKNEKASAPVSVSIVPLSPPVRTVFRDLTLTAAFGGVRIGFKNQSQANLAIELLMDSTGNGAWTTLSTFYTGALEGSFSSRGLDSVEKKFGVVLRDRWNNKSDTLFKKLTPLFEQLIPKDKFSILQLPTDVHIPAEAQYALTNIYNGGTLWNGVWASANNSKIPQWFTLDLGQQVVLSRFKEFQVPDNHFYVASALKTFELWGSNNPNPDGSFDASWTFLGTFHSFKPSGLPMGQTNQDDYNYACANGEDFEFENVIPPIRYLRLNALESYSSSGQIVISELTFWGQIK
jgi:hypothetical protein